MKNVISKNEKRQSFILPFIGGLVGIMTGYFTSLLLNNFTVQLVVIAASAALGVLFSALLFGRPLFTNSYKKAIFEYFAIRTIMTLFFSLLYVGVVGGLFYLLLRGTGLQERIIYHDLQKVVYGVFSIIYIFAPLFYIFVMEDKDVNYSAFLGQFMQYKVVKDGKEKNIFSKRFFAFFRKNKSLYIKEKSFQTMKDSLSLFLMFLPGVPLVLVYGVALLLVVLTFIMFYLLRTVKNQITILLGSTLVVSSMGMASIMSVLSWFLYSSLIDTLTSAFMLSLGTGLFAALLHSVITYPYLKHFSFLIKEKNELFRKEKGDSYFGYYINYYPEKVFDQWKYVRPYFQLIRVINTID